MQLKAVPIVVLASTLAMAAPLEAQEHESSMTVSCLAGTGCLQADFFLHFTDLTAPTHVNYFKIFLDTPGWAFWSSESSHSDWFGTSGALIGYIDAIALSGGGVEGFFNSFPMEIYPADPILRLRLTFDPYLHGSDIAGLTGRYEAYGPSGQSHVLKANGEFPTQPVPEPISLILLASGLLGVGVVAHRRRSDPTA